MNQQPPIDDITRRIVRTFHPARVVVFDSRARGDARPNSDVDLMVEMESDLPARDASVWPIPSPPMVDGCNCLHAR